ncbi:cupin domain-containing protein [Xanthobacter autotrophicus]|uniref:hypothetical protein n=1 Tax=Xanthobacter autotrophicus TaxID=280 RepID=UPI00372C567E
MMLRPGETLTPPLRPSSAVFHVVVSGRGESVVNGERFAWGPADTFSAPVFAAFTHRAEGAEPAFLIRIHDRPLQERLAFFEAPET